MIESENRPPYPSVRERAAADAVPERGGRTLTLPGGVPLFLRRIGPGTFRMGQRDSGRTHEEPVHRVVIPEAFYLGTFPVTQEQWRAVSEPCEALRERTDPSHFKGGRRPVETVSWTEARAFCAWLTENAAVCGLPEDFTADLPTETEWEYACRGGPEGTRTEYWNGDGEAALAEIGWYEENSESETHPVDEPVRPDRPETHPLGLYGTLGNVWEWCADRWDSSAYRKRPGLFEHRHACPPGDENAVRVLRGGSWLNSAGYCRAAIRSRDSAGRRNGYDGFRVGLFSGPVESPGEAKPASGGGSDGTERKPEEPGGAKRPA